jgi:hypothetical protein
MALLGLLGRRWALRVLWELRAGPVPGFREPQSRCGGVSSSVLSDRLTELREAGIVERADDGYRLSARGGAGRGRGGSARHHRGRLVPDREIHRPGDEAQVVHCLVQTQGEPGVAARRDRDPRTQDASVKLPDPSGCSAIVPLASSR